MYLLDSSAIALTLKKLREKSVQHLHGNATLGLAYYELGNIIWKECTLKKQITPEEAANIAEDTAKILGIMRIEEIKSPKNFRQTMKLATELKLTFYDASYLCMAKNKELTLVTEDKEVLEKAKRVDVKAITLGKFISETEKGKEPKSI